jgi:hypothetical protein
MKMLMIKIICDLDDLMDIQVTNIMKSFKDSCKLVLQDYILTRQDYCNSE